MLIAIDYRPVEMSNEENEYYKELLTQLSSNGVNAKKYFSNLFISDDNGLIKIIKPQNSVPWVVIHFMQQIQINQRLRANDEDINNINKRLIKLEEYIKNMEKK